MVVMSSKSILIVPLLMDHRLAIWLTLDITIISFITLPPLLRIIKRICALFLLRCSFYGRHTLRMLTRSSKFCMYLLWQWLFAL